MAVGSPSTARRRQLGRALRKLREDAGLHGDALADRLGCSPSRISRIETARVRITPGTVYEILDALEVNGPDRERLVGLAREAEQPAWWRDYTDTLAGPVTAYFSLEAEASQLQSFEATVVHGLLQTDDYVRAIAHHWGHDSQYVESMIVSRRSRRAVLNRAQPLRFHLILDEAVLHRHVGGPVVMKAQLGWLAKNAARTNINIQVVPFGIGMHSGASGSFNIVSFDDPDEPSAVYVESAQMQTITTRPPTVAGYQTTFKRLEREALSRTRSLALIKAQERAL